MQNYVFAVQFYTLDIFIKKISENFRKLFIFYKEYVIIKVRKENSAELTKG